ncbi:hypothetical protein C84B14_09077 [Salinisphaera sp. C84B14]|uniref:hypothetical protein n=1 Tax=Salinisphaera sp. C84B14 TaxID=1304155 RepID=UPI00333EA51C
MRSAHREKLDTWAKFSWGIFFGSILMAIALNQWSRPDRFGATIPLDGSGYCTVLAAVLLGVYYLRRRYLEKHLAAALEAYLQEFPAGKREQERRRAYRG